jgi:hypothetical protein
MVPLQEPIRRGALNLRRYAMTESAVIPTVLGFCEGMFSMNIENLAEPAST